MFKLLLLTVEFYESNLLVYLRFRLDFFTLLIQLDFKVDLEHRDDFVNERRITGIRRPATLSESMFCNVRFCAVYGSRHSRSMRYDSCKLENVTGSKDHKCNSVGFDLISKCRG